MKKKSRDAGDPGGLDQLIDSITSGAESDDQCLRAFQQACREKIRLPCQAFLAGRPVTVVGFDYDGNPRRGLTARCRADGAEYLVSASDVLISPGAEGVLYHAAYRKWLGLALSTFEVPKPTPKHRPRTAKPALDLGETVDLAVLSVKQKAAACRLLDSDRMVTLRAARLSSLFPGEIVTVTPRKQWIEGGHPYLSGEVMSTRLDVNALGLTPLKLENRGVWNPIEEYWGEPGDPIGMWAKRIIARGPRPQFEMEQVLPGMDYEDPDSDPIGRSNDLRDAGDHPAARTLLMQTCESDLRCLDAHVHLGNLLFDRRPKHAIRHYEVGLRIGELSLGVRFEDFDGVLLWRMIDNRPFLRALNNFGLCLWRLGRFKEAAAVFERLLWFNPPDNQGVRFLVGDVRARVPWKDSESRKN